MSPPLTGPAPVIAGYRWVRVLGAGGFADVHLYRQDAPDREVAIKVLRVSGDGAGADGLSREADALAAVTGHPAIVTLYGTGVTADGRPFLAMEYCPVSGVADQVRAQPMAVAQAVDVMVQLSGAAETLHRAGLVHRDVKPANLMLTRWSQPVLADFGSAARVGAISPTGGGFSLLWAPPEQQVSGTPAHPSQDVWALAATAWTLLAGHSPFEVQVGDNSAAAVADRVRSGRLPALGRPDAPDELVSAMRGALELDPSARTRSALEFAGQLQAVQDRLGRTRTQPLVPVSAQLSSAPQLDDNRTRVRAVPVIEAGAEDRTSPRRALLEVVGPADPEATLPPGILVPEPAAEVARSGLRPWVVALVAGVAVVATAAGVSAAFLGTGGIAPRPEASSAQPQDPVAAPPDPVTGLTGKLTKGRVYWTWAAAATGARYVFTITRPGTEDITKETRLTGTDVAAVPGKDCIELVVVTDVGRESAPVISCVQVR